MKRKTEVKRIFAAFMAMTFLLLVCEPNSIHAKTIRLSPDGDWFSVLSGPSLNGGDEIVLAQGVYTDSRRLQINQRGRAGKPIVIRAADGARVTLKRPDAKQNTINLSGQYLVIRDIEITGGAAGIRIGKSDDHVCKFIMLQNLHIHHIGGVGVTANNPGETYEGMVFRGNHIHHTSGHGEAFYLGANNKPDGSTNGYIFDSVIEKNHIHDLKGPQVSQGDGIELKDGSYNNIVRDNVIHDTNYPGVLVYSTDGKAPNLIERNVIWNTGNHGIQAAADAIIRNNVIFQTNGDGIHSRNHQSAIVGNLKIVHNTILSKSAVRIVTPKQWSGSVVLANNALSVAPRVGQDDQIQQAGNAIGITEKFPSAQSKCVGAADPRFRIDVDFNKTPRAKSNDAGAFRFDPKGNPKKLPVQR